MLTIYLFCLLTLPQKVFTILDHYLLEYVKLSLLVARIWMSSILMLLFWGSGFPLNLPASFLMVCLVNAGAYQSSQGNCSENDPNNTTVFVGGLDSNVDEVYLRQIFTPYGEISYVKIPIGKHCGFVQFTSTLT
ncbi:Polyadenylate-binding protein RBP45 [Zea mays]|uniref:Polyadenylate-binding protein RBP45 n=1 Tax=Zea mays TaxID=4577 RepID=A0A3L6E0Y7_MAIZE|nr:Polyadenylate-binding protein RBP45 [Zea mays]